MIENEIFMLFSNCKPVKGKIQSTICDLQRNRFELIPNDLYYILSKFSGKKKINEIKKIYLYQYNETIDEYFDFLIENEYIFFTSQPKNFPKVKYDFFYPFEVSNAIIILDSDFDINIVEKMLNELDDVNCKCLEIRFYTITSFEKIELIMNFINSEELFIQYIDIFMPYSPKLDSKTLDLFVENNRRINSLIITSALVNNVTNNNIVYTTSIVNSSSCCGNINYNYFTSNIRLFSESLHHNSCLHKKISIDIDGNIKNCPSMPESFGNIKDTTLEEALNHKDFKKYWNITKDQIEVCKDCEFRYICTDCRAYKEDPENDYSKPLKCGYDPYTGEWEEWSKNPLKEKFIQFYGMQDLVKNK